MYLYSNPINSQKSKISYFETFPLKSNPGGQCLRFWYNINGITPGTFNVKLIIENKELVVFTRAETLGK